MIHARYIGPEPTLRGKGALIQPSRYESRQVQAQFDDIAHPLAFGWHPFSALEFIPDHYPSVDPDPEWNLTLAHRTRISFYRKLFVQHALASFKAASPNL